MSNNVFHLFGGNDEKGRHHVEVYSEPGYDEFDDKRHPAIIVRGDHVYLWKETNASSGGYWSHTYVEVDGSVYHACADGCVRRGVVNPRVVELLDVLRRDDA